MRSTNLSDRSTGSGDPQLGLVFGALSDPTRRRMLEAMLREGSASVPTLSSEFPISRQAVAKHIAALQAAGLVERADPAGREVRYRPRPTALAPAAAWIVEAEAAWDARLSRLKQAVESGARPRPG